MTYGRKNSRQGLSNPLAKVALRNGEMVGINLPLSWTLALATGCVCLAGTSAQFAAAQQAPSASPTLTLNEALTTALTNNRNVKIASLGVDGSRQQVHIAKSKRFPALSTYVFGGESLTTISLKIKEGQFGTYPATGPIPGKDTTISSSQTPTAFVMGQVTQPLLALHKINLNVQASKLAVAQSQQQAANTRQSIAANVRQAYYGVAQAQQAVKAVQADIKEYEELDRITEEYVKEKTMLASTGLEVKAKLAQEKYALLQAQDQQQSAEETLNELMGRNIDTDFNVAPVDGLSLAEENLQTAQAQALAQQPSIKEAAITVKQADIQRRLAKAQYLPDLNASVRYISPFGIDFLPTNIAAVGLEFKWDPFDWGARKHTVQQKAIAVEQSKQQLEETKAQVLVNVANQFRALQEARLAISVADMNRTATRQKLSETTDQYKQKTALLRDVLEQQAAAEGADAQYQQAIAAFWTAKANLDKAIGEE